jgi:hypothetical protein
MKSPSDVEQLQGILNDQYDEIFELRRLRAEAESRMALMTQLRDPAQVGAAAEKFTAEIDDLYAGGYGSVKERSARVAEKVADLIVRTAIGTSVASGCSLDFTLTDAAKQKVAAEKSA